MGVLFLDFDGPLFSEKIHFLPENRGDKATQKCKELGLHSHVSYWKADPIAIAMLNTLNQLYPYQLVISSSWANENLHNKEKIMALLDANKLKYTLHTDWMTPRHNQERHEQIQAWLKAHQEIGKKYIILDDIKSGIGLADRYITFKSGIESTNVILVEPEHGLSKKNFYAILEILMTW